MPTINTKSPQRPWKPKRVPYETGRRAARWAGYKTNRWKSMSLLFKTLNPMCCVEGCQEPTYYTDHKIPVLECVDPWAWSNLQPLCFGHGGGKTSDEGHSKKKQYRGKTE